MMNQLIAIICLVLMFGTACNVSAGAIPPQDIQAPPGTVMLLQAQAQGEQIYQCTLAAGEFQWQLKAPEAVLFDAQGQQIGRHYAGPVWEYRDGSRISGKLLHKSDVAPGKAIPWLLLEAAKPQGSGLFTKVRYINRIDTQGGLPPVTACDNNRLGSEKRVPYRASYIFYSAAEQHRKFTTKRTKIIKSSIH